MFIELRLFQKPRLLKIIFGCDPASRSEFFRQSIMVDRQVLKFSITIQENLSYAAVRYLKTERFWELASHPFL